ncbi:glycogen synthase [Aquimarina sp. AU474]|uniref:glycogen synthase n=1 Tax=Aquimarina sp. AU474 TaxID=2108529 RepID=UPI000D68EC12|nr:glycogen/starch synthase [Aquimarina sp. AU474]
MNILHTSFECYPLAKVGGLADVVGALPKFQHDFGFEVNVIMPFYNTPFITKAKYTVNDEGTIQLGDISYAYEIRELSSPDIGFNTYLVYIPHLLDRPEVYGHKDDIERFIAFQLVVLDWLNLKKGIPDIIHCHDHHTGLIPFLIANAYQFQNLKNIPTVFTIHNAQYQGQISYDKLHYLPDFDKNKIGLLDWDQQINPLAAAIKCAWRVTTVSPSYMEELQNSANGLEGLLRHEKAKCQGVLNGIDTKSWDTETDTMLIENYKISTVVSKRTTNKEWLCNEFNLDSSKPLFCFIGRLVYEKGADLLPDIVEESLQSNDINVLMLGSGNKEVEERLESLKDTFSGRYHMYTGYNERLSHIIYGGADFLLMPSRVEPCGLNQMYALRYGAIPIVRRTGGLKDTVVDIGDNGFGICHNQATVQDVCYSIRRGVALYSDQKKYREIQQEIMKIDHSWNRSANQYVNIYKSLITLT